MTELDLRTRTQNIVVDDVFPYEPAAIWKVLTSRQLMGHWFIEPAGFEAVVGTPFTFQARAAGAWNGVIHCRVLEVTAGERLAYDWKCGDGTDRAEKPRLDTVVTWTLSRAKRGTRLRLAHSGFVMPSNEPAFKTLRGVWTKCVQAIVVIAGEQQGAIAVPARDRRGALS